MTLDDHVKVRQEVARLKLMFEEVVKGIPYTPEMWKNAWATSTTLEEAAEWRDRLKAQFRKRTATSITTFALETQMWWRERQAEDYVRQLELADPRAENFWIDQHERAKLVDSLTPRQRYLLGV